jgi:hypothetical protein
VEEDEGECPPSEAGVPERGTIAGDVSTEEWKSDGEEFSVLLCESSSGGKGDWAISGKGGRRGTGEHGKEEGRKKKGWQSESKAWGKIKRETCNFDLFYDLWTGPAGEINTDEAELKGILHLLIW